MPKSYEWDFDGDGVTDQVTTNYDVTYYFQYHRKLAGKADSRRPDYL